MNKKIHFLLTPIALFSVTAALFAGGISASKAEAKTYRVLFFDNIERVPFELSNGMTGIGNNVIYTTVDVNEGSLLEKPMNPARKNYNFNGWFKEEACTNEWDFANDVVNSNLRLFANWEYSHESEEPEPSYTPPSTVLDDSASEDYVVDSVMNFKIDSNTVRVSTAAITKLESAFENVLPLMEYKVKNGKNLSAVYNKSSKKIEIDCGSTHQSISVLDNSSELVLDDATREKKAVNYELNAVQEESYHVMLAGSSSIEFWETSKEDLDPIVSYNHGIGGTTIEEWTTSLNQRLVFPYKPKMAVYYVGINNVVNSGQDTNTIWNHLYDFFESTHQAMPNTKVQYILMNLVPGFPQHFATIEAVNSKAREYQQTNSDWLTLIDPGKSLLKENGKPNHGYFRVDGLHLSYYGYVLWGGVIKQSILDGLKNM